MRFRLVVNGEGHEVETDGGVRVDGRSVAGETAVDARGVTVRIGRKRYRVLITRWGAVVDDRPYRVEVQNLEPSAGFAPTSGRPSPATGRVEVRLPMPGRVVRVLVRVGDRVDRFAPLAVLEAMKMQNEVPAPVAGIVQEVRVKEGQGVLASDILLVLAPD